MDPLAYNYQENATDDDGSCIYHESLIENFSGTTDQGGSFSYEYNFDQSFFRWTDELSGEEQEGSYRDLGSEYRGVLELEIDQETVHTFKSPKGYTVGYFPGENGKHSLAFGTSTDINLADNTAALFGDYVYFFMSPQGVNNNSLYKEWGLISLSNKEFRIVNFATGGEGDYDAIGPHMLDSIDFKLPVNSSYDPSPEFWEYDSEHQERLILASDLGKDLTIYASPNDNQSILAVDVQEEGMGIALKIDDISLSDVAGEYRSIDIDEEGKGLHGTMTLSSSGSLSYNYPGRENNNDDGSISGLIKSETDVSNCFYKENFDEDGTSIFMFFSGDALLYVVLNEDGETVSYGMGYRLES